MWQYSPTQLTGDSPGKVVKVYLGVGTALPIEVATLTLASDEGPLISAVINQASGYGWFGTSDSPGKIVKITLGASYYAPTRVSSITAPNGVNQLRAAAGDTAQLYGYFGSYTAPASILKVALGAGPSPQTDAGEEPLFSGDGISSIELVGYH